MLIAIREVQIPLLAVMLLGACTAKVWRSLRPHADHGRADPSRLLPSRLRRPVTVMMSVAELLLGLGLLGTAGRLGGQHPSLPATVVRTGTALFFLIAVGALNEMRQRSPDSGCGCFGELSETPVGWRTIARAGVLCAAAVATLGLPPLHMPASSAEAELWLAALAFELALIAFLSPELAEVMVRLGYSEPCELRRLPVGRTLGALRASSQWRRYTDQITTDIPADIWREGCWRFVVYPGMSGGRPVDIVFAVYLQSRRPPIRAAILDADTDEVLGPAGTRISAVL
ncbi:MAG: MauE/DoxX family redox-associated membrane protein [Streptosporangiaceae bacterium]